MFYCSGRQRAKLEILLHVNSWIWVDTNLVAFKMSPKHKTNRTATSVYHHLNHWVKNMIKYVPCFLVRLPFGWHIWLLKLWLAFTSGKQIKPLYFTKAFIDFTFMVMLLVEHVHGSDEIASDRYTDELWLSRCRR